jgi:uncharacterized repeat protein (TIGR03803 family)
MTISAFCRCALTNCVAVAMLAGCGGSQPPIGAQSAALRTSAVATPRVIGPETTSSGYHLLYSFAGDSDGAYPAAALIDVNGTLHGTTEAGGGFRCHHGCGTVYSLSTGGSESVQHSFGVRSDGAYPVAALIESDDALYGTTEYGGKNTQHCVDRYRYEGCGTVFSMGASGSANVLHYFTGRPDGAYPAGALIDVNGTLYGTTEQGGASQGCELQKPKLGCGTVYSISAHGAEKVLYHFGGPPDGASPAAGLMDMDGTLYGTTQYGGSGYGTVFSISAGGTEKVLYRFAGPPDGASPTAGLVEVKGTLYGTTAHGGAYFKSQNPGGTVFSVSTKGAEHVLHSFGSGADGTVPFAGLINVKGVLYGTTAGGGSGSLHAGTIYSISTTGDEKVLYSFANTSTGVGPLAGLIDVNGTLYGTTEAGGGSGCGGDGCGTVFAFTP